MDLSGAKTAELAAELERRRKQEMPDDDTRFCDDCRNFVPWNDDHKEPPAEFTVCGKGHDTAFYVTKDYAETLQGFGGYYRKFCEDYKDAPPMPRTAAIQYCKLEEFKPKK